MMRKRKTQLKCVKGHTDKRIRKCRVRVRLVSENQPFEQNLDLREEDYNRSRQKHQYNLSDVADIQHPKNAIEKKNLCS
jgi:hypothetical protein